MPRKRNSKVSRFVRVADTLNALRSLSPDIPVILSSGYDEDQVMAGEHPNVFLSKPYQLKGLGDASRRAAYGSDWHG